MDRQTDDSTERETGHAVLESPIIGGICHKYDFCRDKGFSPQTPVCHDKTSLWSRRKYACREVAFVEAKLCLSRQNFCHVFVKTKPLSRVCRDRSMLVVTNVLSRQTYFLRDKPYRATKTEKQKVCVCVWGGGGGGPGGPTRADSERNERHREGGGSRGGGRGGGVEGGEEW